MVIEPTAKMRNDDIGWLFCGLDLAIVARLDVLQIIVDRPFQVTFVVDCILVNSTREANIGVRVNENFEIDDCG
jgi:hypothetical protein